MSLIKHNALIRTLEETGKGGLPNIYLICGDPYLVRQAFDQLTGFWLRGQSREFALETLDGRSTPLGDVIEQATTFSFLKSDKVIAVKDAPLFTVKAAPGEISYSAKELDRLTDLAEKGIPENHILVMTTSVPDRRKKIFKAIQEAGCIVDCTVATGVRKADIEEQEGVLRDLSRQLLAGTGKQMAAQAFSLLVEQTGFNPEVFAGNVEKLLAYTGTRAQITVRDVSAVVRRDKKDPIFSLTNAVMDRDTPRALVLLDSLFSEGFHPLQILKTLENQLRKALFVKLFLSGLYRETTGLPPVKTMHFNGFKQVLLPKVVAFDEALSKQISLWEDELQTDGDKKSKPVANDLLLAPNPKNAYPVFQTFLKSEQFSLDELRSALMRLSDLDVSLKTSAVRAETGIEHFIVTLCRKGGDL